MEMKVCILFLGMFALSVAYPARNSDNGESDVEFVPLEKQKPGTLPVFFNPFDSEEDGSSYFPSFSNPFPGLYDQIQGVMTSMRRQLHQILNRLPSKDGPDFPELHIPHFDDIDLSKGNTTSVVKHIDGHKVVINETEYNKNNEHGNSFFKVRIINVEPDEGNTEKIPESKTTATENREVEAVESSNENEITKNKEAYENIETFDEPDYNNKHEEQWNWNDLNPIESFEDNELETSKREQNYADLSNDIYVNQIMADAGAPMNPDAELIEGGETNNPAMIIRRRQH